MLNDKPITVSLSLSPASTPTVGLAVVNERFQSTSARLIAIAGKRLLTLDVVANEPLTQVQR